ncbi:hypothetical protein FD29_GL001576 [Companilactobacillus mindensis DSM 14500]|uniref:DUF2255 family protein n=1 Tax=Companilactobacillus mindensis DSM 14500 TaxID=1423770 RepID=A0A0R1QL76_9LACO|nr:DUF2255 family protein [Companilactobacillus mindensis]KRL42706.1 hypothetical protein FD29_GL001576 [Companilactobacillus mindensis DSM 14500]GEO78514.1 hypothetical protein LMI01_08450 [Companilactobacillus mindensis]
MENKTWSNQELKSFKVADDFRVSPFYSDGKTYGTPTWIWSVVVDKQLFIRAWNGQQSRWYRSAIQQKAGRIFLAEHNHEVNFIPLEDEALNYKVDQAYQLKYGDSPYFYPMVQSGPRSTTLKIVPRNN